MKLKGYLKTLNEKDIVSIATKEGTNYVYIGEAGNVELISKMFEDYHKRVANKFEELKYDIKALALSTPELGEDDDENLDIVLDYSKRIANTYVNFGRSKKYLLGYVDPMKRCVITTEQRDAEKGVRVIISGSENGKYWFKSEFDKDH